MTHIHTNGAYGLKLHSTVSVRATARFMMPQETERGAVIAGVCVAGTTPEFDITFGGTWCNQVPDAHVSVYRSWREVGPHELALVLHEPAMHLAHFFGIMREKLSPGGFQLVPSTLLVARVIGYAERPFLAVATFDERNVYLSRRLNDEQETWPSGTAFASVQP